jgi:fatty acid desaturase
MAGMDQVPRELLRAAYRRKPIHLLKIPFGYGMGALVVWVLYATQHSRYFVPIGIGCSLLISYLIRGLGAVAHDAVHGNLTRSKRLTYWLALSCWAPSGMSLTVYRNYHLHHHRIANTYPDVDNFVVTDYVTHPVAAKALLLAIYTFAYPIYFTFQMFRYVRRLTPGERTLMTVELLAWWSLIALAAWVMPFGVFFFFYMLPFLFGSVLASVTSMIEHMNMPASDDDAYSSRTYGTACHITNFLWNNVTYHNEHHKYPGIPFYNLASFHHAAYPHYDDRVKAACHRSIYRLAFKLYGDILRLDVEEMRRRYAKLDKAAERERLMALPGISPALPVVPDGVATSSA